MDVFSLGLVAFFSLSGGALHRAARKTPIDPSALWQELTSPLDSASLRARELGASVDPAFDVWFQRALAPLPQARFSSVSAMASAFDAIARTLVAPQSQNAVALQGIAAAIAQPLAFQPDAPPPTSPLGDAPPTLPGVRKKTAAPLLIGGAVLCFAVTALGVGGLYYHGRTVAEETATEASASAVVASAAASAAIAAAAAAAAVTPPVPVSAPPTEAAAVVPTTTAATPTQIAAPAAAATPEVTALVTPKPAVTSAVAKPAAVSSVVAATKPAAAPPAKSAAIGRAKAAVTAAPVKAVATAKPTLLVPPKKKCGSTFIPCK